MKKPQKQPKVRSRGRPKGPSADGLAMRQRLFEVATALIAEAGYGATTLRQIADEAGVSVGNVYHYFPSKEAVALELYDQLSLAYAGKAESMPDGPWLPRVLFAFDTALGVLGPHRKVLRELLGLLLSDPEHGLLASATNDSRARVMQVFEEAVTGATDAPDAAFAHTLGRLAYLAHMAGLLFWLLDRSPKARATHGLTTRVRVLGPMVSPMLALPFVREALIGVETAIEDALRLG